LLEPLSIARRDGAGGIPINIGDTKYDPLFPYGFGLSYERARSQ
jgi:hypothetical protein